MRNKQTFKQMTKIQKVSKEGRIANYLIYVLADMLETIIPFAEREAVKAGLDFNKREKPLINQMKWVSKDLTKVVRGITLDSQYDFGETSDNLLKVILLTMDRAGEKPEKLNMIIRFIESINSEENINIKRFNI